MIYLDFTKAFDKVDHGVTRKNSQPCNVRLGKK